MARRVQVNIEDTTVRAFLEVAREWQMEKNDLKIGVGTVVGALLDAILKDRPELVEQLLKKAAKKEALPKERSGPRPPKGKQVAA